MGEEDGQEEPGCRPTTHVLTLPRSPPRPHRTQEMPAAVGRIDPVVRELWELRIEKLHPEVPRLQARHLPQAQAGEPVLQDRGRRRRAEYGNFRLWRFLESIPSGSIGAMPPRMCCMAWSCSSK